ncbi:MAG: hypothetical protein RQ743_02970 [Bacteroidales bacterium]|nr:hypothetical protein [Bacteroidales bacterium]
MNKLDRLIRQLRMHKPEIHDRKVLKEGIMQKISNTNRKVDYLFGWTEITWLRRSLSIAAVLIAGLFVGQQLFLVNRISGIEERMVGFNTDNILEFQRENVIANQVIMQDPETSILADSIKVSTDDLLKLIREYRELQDKYQQIIGSKKKGINNHAVQKL